METHYEVLNVAITANEAVIKRAYHKLERTHHPDITLGLLDKERVERELTFKYANTACENLCDLGKCAAYDRGLSRTHALPPPQPRRRRRRPPPTRANNHHTRQPQTRQEAYPNPFAGFFEHFGAYLNHPRPNSAPPTLEGFVDYLRISDPRITPSPSPEAKPSLFADAKRSTSTDLSIHTTLRYVLLVRDVGRSSST
jgi:curved DNA-binding protein CbpA